MLAETVRARLWFRRFRQAGQLIEAIDRKRARRESRENSASAAFRGAPVSRGCYASRVHIRVYEISVQVAYEDDNERRSQAHQSAVGGQRE